jgi:hypothetical protein
VSVDLFPLMSPTWLSCNSALLTLSRFELSVEPRPEEAHHKDVFQSRAALGVQSVLRMVLDGVHRSTSVSDAEVMSVPIWSFHHAYLATLSSLELGIVDEDGEKWTMYIQGLKRMLKTLEPGCRLAGTILSCLSKISVQ